ncbi:PREDICTED: phospholipid scramblase 1-like [Priapulus caudatus]|uniref:Phospholipid scramblase n=1 Tax=Priapulus caudatus TaxID=37621 RepID=A0ABM1F925_PRICU|nr:PREDICTED: phospholipid scramblase 1-like [Priapulus caudatus]
MIPPGLEYLTQIDQLLVQQQKEMLEIFTGWESQNKYKIANTLGQPVYFSTEDSNLCERQCCKNARSFTMAIVDTTGREVISLERPLRCTSMGCCCCYSWLQEVKVYAPRGSLIGTVHENFNYCVPKYSIFNAAHDEIFRIEGDTCACACLGGNVNFEILSSATGERIGRIQKQWTGLVREMFTDADNFGVQFPLDLDVKMKAILLGALFLIDFVYFERNG